jgi:hypothetical protein
MVGRVSTRHLLQGREPTAGAADRSHSVSPQEATYIYPLRELKPSTV